MREHYGRHRIKPHIVRQGGYWRVYFRNGFCGGGTVLEAWMRHMMRDRSYDS